MRRHEERKIRPYLVEVLEKRTDLRNTWKAPWIVVVAGERKDDGIVASPQLRVADELRRKSLEEVRKIAPIDVLVSVEDVNVERSCW